MNRILAAIDFSDVTTTVIRQAESLAHAFQAELHLLHVAPPDPDFVGYEAGPQTVRDDVAHELRGEHHQVQAEAERIRESGVEATAHMIQGATVDTILAEADRLDVDLIVIGSHGHGALFRAILGSVSEGVLHRASRPLLVMPSRLARSIS